LGSIWKTCAKGASALALTVAMAAPSWAETLAEAMTAAYNFSGVIEQNRAVMRAADEDVAQAISRLRPVFSWTGNIQRQFGTRGTTTAAGFVTTGISNNTASISLLAELVLFNGYRRKLGIDAAKESVLAARAGLLAVEQQVLFRTVSAFMEMRRATETVALRQNNVRVIRQEVRAARDRFDVGEVTRTDVALAEARLAAARSSLSAAEGALVAAVEEYRAVVGRKPGRLVAPKKLPKLPNDVEYAKLKAARNHPEMIRAQHIVTAGDIGILIAEGAKKPTVSLRGQLGVTEDLNDRDFTRSGSISLNASGPIYSGGALASAVRQAIAQRDQARGGLHNTLAQIKRNVGNAYVQLRVAQASRASFEQQVRAATVAFRGVREEAKLGARTTLDVLDAEQEFLDARANLISAQVDETIAAYAVLASLGLLTADALKLPVPTYDPAQYYNLVKTAPAAMSKQGRELDRVLRALGKE
jgi:outer membrane protein